MKAGLRLGLARLHWKHCHAFRFAHKPLCPQFRSDLLHIRGIWLCRSCCLLWLGILLGNLLWLAVADTLPPYFIAVYLAMLLFVSLPSLPVAYKSLPRLLRDMLRFGAGLLIAATPFVAIRLSLIAGLLGALYILLFRHFYLRSRRRRSNASCRDCPARNAEVVCEGFRLQTDCLRRYEEEATEYLYAKGYVPPGFG